MSKTSIIYSPANLDSCLAAAVAILIAKTENIGLPASSVYDSFAYSRGLGNNSLPVHTYDKPVEKIVILGADLSPMDMENLLINNPLALIKMYTYPNATIYSNVLKKQFIDRELTYLSFDIKNIDAGLCEDPSISMCLIRSINDEPPEFSKHVNYPLLREFQEKLMKFIRLEDIKRPDGKWALQDEDMWFLNTNITMIRKAARGASPLEMLGIGTDLKAAKNAYKDYVDEVRHTLNTNLQQVVYAGANGFAFYTPTVAITERDAMLGMRLVRYVYPEVISYEDQRDARVYRIMSEKNLAWYIKRFQPHDVWSEGSFVYIKTKLPVHTL